MKSFLSILLVLVLIATMGGTCYLLYQKSAAAPAIATPQPTAAAQSSSAPQLPKKLVEELSGSTTDPEILEDLMYEIGKNPDTVGWLTVPGTDINNSVVQSHNNSYYLRRDERKQDAVYGCYYADYECSVSDRNNLTPNTVIYGHSDLKDNPDGPRFSQLFRFTDPKFAEEHRTILLSTPEETLEWEIFSVFYTDVNFDYIRVELTPEDLKAISDKAVSLSVHDYGLVPTGEDKLLTLSTCSVRDGSDGNHRFVVMARLKK
ncbi:MAG: class B sortase [Angelakisella sp.]